jgi:hypothetical protein
MPLARLNGRQHDLLQAKPRLALLPGLNVVQSNPADGHYEPPTPTSLGATPSPKSGSSGSASSLPSSSRPETPVLAGILPRPPRLPLLYPRPQRRVASASQKAHDDVNLSLRDRECPVCRRRGCLLVSHKLYASRQRSGRSQPARTTVVVVDKQPPPAFTLSIGNARLDPFFDLPTGSSDPEMQQRFRNFFTAQCSSMTSPVRILAFDVAYCPVLVRQASADPALCHTIVAMEATYASVHGQGLQAPDTKLLSIYGRTLQVLRKQVSQASHGKPSDSAIMAAVNLLMCHGIAWGDKSAIAAHPAALKHLVDACGGLSNISSQPAALTLWADFYVTLYTGKKPIFLEQAAVMPDIPLSNPPPAVYGAGLDSLAIRGLVPMALLDVCQNMCRLTELLEDRVSGNTNPARWEYFDYKRNTMAMRNGIVHAELFRSGTKAECISLIHNLYLFLVLRLMPWKAPIINLCNQLRSALLASGLDDYWGRDIDVLLWVLFILLASAEYWEGRPWALQLLLDTLSHHYRCRPTGWPPDWCEVQWRNLMTFTWSKIYLTNSFEATCRDLVSSHQSHPPVTEEEEQEGEGEEQPFFVRYAVPNARFKTA